MKTTLEQELLQAAEAEGALGNWGRAARLRARAAQVRRIGDEPSSNSRGADVAVYVRLTGPDIEPAPTPAPQLPDSVICRGCSAEYRPGVTVIACPACGSASWRERHAPTTHGGTDHE